MSKIKLVIERSRFAAGQYDKNLANEAEAELTAMQARIEKLEAALKEIDETLSGNLPITILVKEIAKEALK